MLAPDRCPRLISSVARVAGCNALAYFRARYPGQVVATMGLQSRLDGDCVISLASEDRAGLADLFREHGFRSVLNATGNCALQSCELDPETSHRLNLVSPTNTAS